MTLFSILVVRGISFAARARNPFVRYASFGISSYILFHVIQNVGMTVGLIPVTGIPLPLVSYGGSSLLVTRPSSWSVSTPTANVWAVRAGGTFRSRRTSTSTTCD